MIPYIGPSFRIKELLDFIARRNLLAETALKKFRSMGARAIYVRKKQRYALAAFLADLGWKDKKILVPAYTCRSVAEAVRASGNQPVFYDLTTDFTVNLASLGRPACATAAAVIVSDVYGVKMDIGPWLAGLSEKPLVIGDFAHHDFFGFDRDFRRYFDVVMYSTAYYKPMTASDAGYLLVLSPKSTILKDNIRLSNGWWPNFLESMKLCLIGLILKSFWVKILYRFLRSPLDMKEDIERHQSASAVSVALSQIVEKFGEVPGSSLRPYEMYCRAFDGIRRIPPSADATYFTVLIHDSKRNDLRREALKKGLLLGQIFSDIAGKADPSCPLANEFARKAVNLPYLETGSYAEEVIKILKSELEKYAEK